MDLIDRQAAIDAVSKACEECRGTFGRCKENLLALPSAEPERKIELDGAETQIEILSALRTQFNCFDEAEEPVYRALSDAICALSAQPSYSCSHEKDAQPRMKGRWIKQIDESINAWWYECSVCGDYPLKDAFGHDSLSQFCPWCGAELSEGEEDGN